MPSVLSGTITAWQSCGTRSGSEENVPVSMLSLLRLPPALAGAIVIGGAMVAISFLEPTLQPFLAGEPFYLSEAQVQSASVGGRRGLSRGRCTARRRALVLASRFRSGFKLAFAQYTWRSSHPRVAFLPLCLADGPRIQRSNDSLYRGIALRWPAFALAR
eukprot:scaffold132622_cov30-Tisochrysis_lutea.AAC.2